MVEGEHRGDERGENVVRGYGRVGYREVDWFQSSLKKGVDLFFLYFGLEKQEPQVSNFL